MQRSVTRSKTSCFLMWPTISSRTKRTSVLVGLSASRRPHKTTCGVSSVWLLGCIGALWSEEMKLRSVNVWNLPKNHWQVTTWWFWRFPRNSSLNNCTNHSLRNHCRPTVTGAKQPSHLEWYGALCVPHHSALRVGACSSGKKCGIWVTCFYRDVISLQENVAVLGE